MNVIFFTIGKIGNIEDHAIYTDLLRTFRNRGHNVYVVSANEKRNGKDTEFAVENGVHTLRVRIGNITKCGIVEKGISTLQIESKFIRAIQKYVSDVKFDLVMYSTPPITFSKVVEYIKTRDGAKSYLLLKDIFPQNAVDLGMMTKTGVKSIIYHFFRKKEKKLYALSDRIGCMSKANVDFVIRHNPEVNPENVEICPNSIDLRDLSLGEEEKRAMRKKYQIPLDKKVFIYGGNLGKPQGISFLINALKSQFANDKVYFLIVGDGTEFHKLQNFFEKAKPSNMLLIRRLPKEDYERIMAACDIGLIFLDHRFTIPNFPSRLLSYMQARLPVLACTDVNTDVGKVITEGEFGIWCESNNVSDFEKAVELMCHSDLKKMGDNGYEYLEANYTVEKSYHTIMDRINE